MGRRARVRVFRQRNNPPAIPIYEPSYNPPLFMLPIPPMIIVSAARRRALDSIPQEVPAMGAYNPPARLANIPEIAKVMKVTTFWLTPQA